MCLENLQLVTDTIIIVACIAAFTIMAWAAFRG